MALVDGQRNFRSHYYEKVNLKQVMVASNVVLQVGFRGVEEKKSLDLLLGEKPVDLARIQNFCLRFPLPSIYRIQVILNQASQLLPVYCNLESLWCALSLVNDSLYKCFQSLHPGCLIQLV